MKRESEVFKCKGGKRERMSFRIVSTLILIQIHNVEVKSRILLYYIKTRDYCRLCNDTANQPSQHLRVVSMSFGCSIVIIGVLLLLMLVPIAATVVARVDKNIHFLVGMSYIRHVNFGISVCACKVYVYIYICILLWLDTFSDGILCTEPRKVLGWVIHSLSYNTYFEVFTVMLGFWLDSHCLTQNRDFAIAWDYFLNECNGACVCLFAGFDCFALAIVQ